MQNLVIVLLIIFKTNIVVASDFPPSTEANKKTIQALIDVGANLEKPHALKHHFYGSDRELLNALILKGKSMGYDVQKIEKREYNGKHYWFGSLVKKQMLDLSLINKENSIMIALAEQFQVNYDGWGTQAVE